MHDQSYSACVTGFKVKGWKGHSMFVLTPNASAVLLMVLHSCFLVQEVAHGASAGSFETDHDPFWL